MSKRNPLNIEKRLEIIQDLKSGLSLKTVAAKHNAPRTTIRRTRNCAPNILKFVQYGNEMKKGKRIRGPMYEEIEYRLYAWFLDRKKQGAPLSNPLLMIKAMKISRECGVFPKFKASDGWLRKFKSRHNIILVNKIAQQRISENRNRIIPWISASDKKKDEDKEKEDDCAGVQVESEIDDNRNQIISQEDTSDQEMDEDEEKEDDSAGEVQIESEIDVKEEKVQHNCYNYHEGQLEQQNGNEGEIDVKDEKIDYSCFNYHEEQLEQQSENNKRELSDLFARLESHSARAPPYIQMMMTGLKMFFLPEK